MSAIVKHEKKQNCTVFLNTEETYRNLQPFESIDELNENTKAIRELYANKMTPSTYKVLDVLHRYACKYTGVSYRSKAKIAEELGIDRKTVTRACATLEALGVIKQYETKRARGDRRRSTNAIVFVDVRSLVPTDVPADCPDEDAPANTPPKDIKRYTDVTEKGDNHMNDSSSNLDDKKNIDSDRLPPGWFSEASAYANDAKDLYAITGTLYKAKKGTEIRIEDHIAEFAHVLRNAWYKFKTGKVDESKKYAYLFVAFRSTALRIENAEAIALRQAQIAAFFDPGYSEKIEINGETGGQGVDTSMDAMTKVMFGG